MQAESKLKKATDDYKTLVEKHSTTRGDFQAKMTDSANVSYHKYDKYDT